MSAEAGPTLPPLPATPGWTPAQSADTTDVVILRRHGDDAIDRGGTPFWEIYRAGIVELSSIRTYEEAKRRGESLARHHRVSLVYVHSPRQPRPRREWLGNFGGNA